MNINKFINTYRGFNFESSTGLTEEYNTFNKGFKSIIKSIANNLGGTITGFKPNHFNTSGFITVGDKHIYIYISDVRYFKDEWLNNILIRTASDTKDYIGGMNHTSELKNLRAEVEKLLELNQ